MLFTHTYLSTTHTHTHTRTHTHTPPEREPSSLLCSSLLFSPHLLAHKHLPVQFVDGPCRLLSLLEGAERKVTHLGGRRGEGKRSDGGGRKVRGAMRMMTLPLECSCASLHRSSYLVLLLLPSPPPPSVIVVVLRICLGDVGGHGGVRCGRAVPPAPTGTVLVRTLHDKRKRDERGPQC